jgi:hypothetical protein
MDLNFTPKAIYNIEKASGKSFQTLVTDFSLSNVVLFVQEGLGFSNQEQAFSAVSEYLEKPEHNAYLLFVDILDALRQKGFLPKEMDMEEMRRGMMATSASAGKAVKKQLSSSDSI